MNGKTVRKLVDQPIVIKYNKRRKEVFVMNYDIRKITIEQLYAIVDILHPCMDDYLYVYDLKNDYYFISPSAMQRFNLPNHEFHDVAKTHELFVHPEDLQVLVADLAMMKSGEKSFHNLQYRWLDREKQPIWINCRGCSLLDEEGNPYLMLGCINEIGAKQKADNVSGLLGETSLRSYLWNYKGNFLNGFILRIGIDDFKDINENHGMEYGDMILRRTAHCIAESITPVQQLYRVVADEFVIVDFLNGKEQEALDLYRRIRHEMDAFIEENRYEVVYTVSGGLLLSESIEDASFSNIMKLSEFSLNEAKRNGKNKCYKYCQEDYNRYLKKKETIHALRKAVYNNFEGFETYFQPIVESKSERLRSAETLLRFTSPETGSIPPIEFIPLLEETGLIIPVGKWVLGRALETCKEIHNYLPEFKIGINLSYIQVMKSHILNEIMLGVKEYGLSPSDVTIELTESGFLESNNNFTKFWENVKQEGLELAIDDFGTGYSNFHYLYELNPNIIKIDRSFTVRALSNEYEYRLLEYIIEMTHSIDLKLCIEGIETPQELQKVRMLNPDYIQGFFFGRPCSYEEFFDSYIKIEEK